MGVVRYDSYTDKFIYEEDLVSTTATCTGCIQKPFEITEEAIDKIADVVVRKLRANQTILDGNSYIRGFTDGRESMRKLFEQSDDCQWK